MGTEAAQAAPGAERRPRATTPRRETWRTWIDGRSSRAGPAWRQAPRFWAPPAAPRRLRQPTTRSPARRLASCGRPQGERLRVQHRGTRAHYGICRRGNLRHRRGGGRLCRRARRAHRRGGGREGGLPPEGGHGLGQRQRLLLRRKGPLEPRRHRAVAQRLGPPQRLAHQQRAVQLLCGICRGGRALGYQPGTLGRHRAHRVPHRQLHPLRRWRRRRRVRCHPGLEPGSYGGPGPEGGRGRRHVLLRDPLRAAGPGGGRHRNGRHRQAKGRQLRQAQRHQGRRAGRRRLHEQRVHGGPQFARRRHVPPVPGEPHRRRPHPRYSGGRPHGAPRPCAADPHQLHRPLYVLPLPGPRCPRQALLQRDHPHEQPEHLHVRHLQARGPRHPLPHFRL